MTKEHRRAKGNRRSASVIHSSFGIPASSLLIHIPLVALLGFQLFDVLVGLIDGLATVFLDDLAQSCIDVLAMRRASPHTKNWAPSESIHFQISDAFSAI